MQRRPQRRPELPVQIEHVSDAVHGLLVIDDEDAGTEIAVIRGANEEAEEEPGGGEQARPKPALASERVASMWT